MRIGPLGLVGALALCACPAPTPSTSPDAGVDAGLAAVDGGVSGLGDVRDWLQRHVPGPAAFTSEDPLWVVIASGTGTRIRAVDLQPASTSADPIGGAPDTRGLSWYDGQGGIQALHLAIAAMQAAGWTPCAINSAKARFLLWGFGAEHRGVDFYYRAAEEIGTDLFKVHSLGGENAAIDGPLKDNLPAYTARSLDTDANALHQALEAHAAGSSKPPRAFLVGHSWGAAYAAYTLTHAYTVEPSPAYSMVAAILAASPIKVATRPFEFTPGGCPEDLQDLPGGGLPLTCGVPGCRASPGTRATCALRGPDSLREVPTYSIDRPDDPIPPCDPGTIGSGWQQSQGSYPGIAGHDYLVRENGSFEARSAWMWGGGGSCAPGAVEQVQLVVGGGEQRFVGLFGIDSLRVSCGIGYGTRLHYPGSCRDDSAVRSGQGVAWDGACASTAAGTHDAVCVHVKVVDPEHGTVAAGAQDACFVTTSHDATALLANPGSVSRRASAGFVSCP